MKMPELSKAFVITVSQICKGFEAVRRELGAEAWARPKRRVIILAVLLGGQALSAIY